MSARTVATFDRVIPSPAELAAWHDRHRHRQSEPPRVRCRRCGARLWQAGAELYRHADHCPGPLRWWEEEE